MSQEILSRLARIKDPELHRWLYEIASIARPSSIYVVTGELKEAKIYLL
jgi:GTP-dependent phosphoenolpyruvate carboxykinase